MKYAMIEYDFSRPTNKVLTEPLDSDYGIAVKTYINGVEKPSNLEIPFVGQPTEVPNGWQLFELSTGSTPCTKNYGISASVINVEHIGFAGTEELKNTNPFPMTLHAKFYLSSYFDVKEDTVVYSNAVDVFKGYGNGQEVPAKDMKLFVPNDGGLKDYCLSAGEWTDPLSGNTQPLLVIDDTSYVQVSYQVPASSQTEVRAVVEMNAETGTTDTTFNLQVNETDLGYIDVISQ